MELGLSAPEPATTRASRGHMEVVRCGAGAAKAYTRPESDGVAGLRVRATLAVARTTGS